MALLDRDAPHVVHVQNRKPVRDDGGRKVMENVGDPETVRCAVQVARDWSQAEETSGVIGLQILDLRVVISRTWPGNEYSTATWENDIYEMVGAPQHLSMSRRTSHWRITMRRIRSVNPED